MGFAFGSLDGTNCEMVTVGRGSETRGAALTGARGRRENSADASGNTHDSSSPCECSSWPNSTAWWLASTCATRTAAASNGPVSCRICNVQRVPERKAI